MFWCKPRGDWFSFGKNVPLQEAFIHKPELCDACFNMDGCTLFDYFWTIEQKHLPMDSKAWKSQDNFLNNSDWIRLKKEKSYFQ